MKKLNFAFKTGLISLSVLTVLTGCKGSAYYAQKHANDQKEQADTSQQEASDKEVQEDVKDEAPSADKEVTEDSKAEERSGSGEPELKEPGRKSDEKSSSIKKRRPPGVEDSSSEHEQGTWVTEKKEDVVKYDNDPWTGYYLADDNKSLYITPNGDKGLRADYISYSEDGWTEGSAEISLASDDENKAYMDMGYAVFELQLSDKRIVLDASEAGGSFMEDRYYKTDGVPDGTFMMDRGEKTPADYYAAATFLTADEVEDYAVKLRLNLLYSNIDWIMNNAAYPFALCGEIIEDEDELYAALSSEDSILFNYKFLDSIKECNCRRMFVNSDGIAMGDGYVWFRETMDGNLCIIALNSP
ncbi:MAG: hypothetical protein IJM23_08555 [Lachnospiraceae bacterium]|nr:hypothetical protein [Lachnospiraceae bacterium]